MKVKNQTTTAMRNKITLVLLSIAVGSQAYAVTTTSNDDGYRRVGHVKWHKEAKADVDGVMNAHVSNNVTNVVFIRQADLDPLQTSANIAINDRFQVSLQPGNYSQVYSCAGINVLSSGITGDKHNDLSINPQTHNLAGGSTYYFYVEVDEGGQSNISPINEQNAKFLLENTKRQTHQISRVVPNCPAPTTPPPPKPVPAPEVVEKRTMAIELEVLFDTDKHFVKERYYEEVKRVSDFMKQYPHATVVIEGHTDSRASEAYNQALSERRAKAVKDVLVKTYGVDSSVITTEGHGELRPRATNDTKEGRQLNRRVMAVFTY